MVISIENSIYSKCSDPLVIRDCFAYKKTMWIQRRFGKERKESVRYLIDIKSGRFLTGFLPKVRKFCKDNNIKYSIMGDIPRIIPSSFNPTLKGIQFRDDQTEIIKIMLDRQRGVFKAPTGLGKTIVFSGILSCFKDKHALVLCHEETLLNQTYDELIKVYGKNNVGRIGSKYHKEIKNATVALVQSFVNLDANKLRDFFDIIIVDECHIGMDIGSNYYKILTNINAPVRIGVTATLPESNISKLVLEGLFGKTFSNMTYSSAIDLGLLAKPKIKLYKTDFSYDIKALHKYAEVYNKGIVNNKNRNEKIINVAFDFIKQDKTILIFVTQIEHGKNLEKIAKENGLNIPFIYGNTDTESRSISKKLFEDRKIKCVVASVVWKHGINFPTLDVVINACGEKSEVATIQRIGRGFRVSGNKKEIIIVDFFDPSHPYLVNHFGHRVTMYMAENWL